MERFGEYAVDLGDIVSHVLATNRNIPKQLELHRHKRTKSVKAPDPEQYALLFPSGLLPVPEALSHKDASAG